MSPVSAKSPPLTLAAYGKSAEATDRFAGDPRALERLRFGYFGEVGGLLAAVKKAGRDTLLESETEIAGEEIGDALWYLFSVAHEVGVSPDELGKHCLQILRGKFNEAEGPERSPANFRQIDGILAVHHDPAANDRPALLGRIAHSAGLLADQSDENLRNMAPPEKAAHLGRLLAGIAEVCSAFHVLIEEVAYNNLAKIVSRWPGPDPQPIALFDECSEIPDYERLPRQFEIDFLERGTVRNGHVVQRLNGVYIGDRLTDNSNEPDDYRFHDVFHLAYVAHLGWSPVIRGLLKRKRKFNPMIDENEDGARAAIIEEGIATWIFNHAKKRNFYDGVEVGKLEYGLLKQIHSMVMGYEAGRCPLWQWELAILRGFDVFRSLKTYRGGTVCIDMLKRSISFKPFDDTETGR